MNANAHTAHPLVGLVVELCMQAQRILHQDQRAHEAMLVLPMDTARKLEQATGRCLRHLNFFGIHVRYDGTDPCAYVLLFEQHNPVAIKQQYLRINPLRQLLAEANIHTE